MFKTSEPTLKMQIICNWKQADKILNIFKNRGYDVKRCCICKKKIVNYEKLRPPINVLEKALSYFGVKFRRWVCNFGQPVHGSKKFTCKSFACYSDILDDVVQEHYSKMK